MFRQMEKLIELLNEWSKTAIKNKCNWTDVYDEEGVYFLNLFDRDMTMEIEDVISKRNGFIKWLVENDKIDIVKVYENLTNYEIEIRIRAVKELLENNEEDTIAYLKLLMLLSISDTPIEDLISYLK